VEKYLLSTQLIMGEYLEYTKTKATNGEEINNKMQN
jgi:hypothetical protein